MGQRGHCPTVARYRSVFGIAMAVDFDASSPHEEVGPAVSDASDDSGNPHQDDSKDDGVVMAGHAIPHTLEAFTVKGVVADAVKIERNEKEAEKVYPSAHQQAVAECEDPAIQGVVADEDVAIAAHRRQRHEGPHARDGAQAANGAAQARETFEKLVSDRLSCEQKANK